MPERDARAAVAVLRAEVPAAGGRRSRGRGAGGRRGDPARAVQREAVGGRGVVDRQLDSGQHEGAGLRAARGRVVGPRARRQGPDGGGDPGARAVPVGQAGAGRGHGAPRAGAGGHAGTQEGARGGPARVRAGAEGRRWRAAEGEVMREAGLRYLRRRSAAR